MTHRFFLAALTALALLLSPTAFAHDPSLHEPRPAPKAKPMTCVQLADTERYSADAADPAIKALKSRCEAARKAAPKAAPEKSGNGS